MSSAKSSQRRWQARTNAATRLFALHSETHERRHLRQAEAALALVA